MQTDEKWFWCIEHEQAHEGRYCGEGCCNEFGVESCIDVGPWFTKKEAESFPVRKVSQ